MLMLTRKSGENIMIGDQIKIRVLGVTAGKVQIGIDAPKSIAVHRKEVYDRIQSKPKFVK